jgi:hypothetical protein
LLKSVLSANGSLLYSAWFASRVAGVASCCGAAAKAVIDKDDNIPASARFLAI